MSRDDQVFQSQKWLDGRIEAINADCLEYMGWWFPPEEMDLIMTDLPYGTTYAEWDKVVPMTPLWSMLSTIAKPNAPYVFTAVQPFTTALIASNPSWFRHAWVWDKVYASNFANAKRGPMKSHEDVIVFAQNQPFYHPQMTEGKKNHSVGKSKSQKTVTRRLETRAPDRTDGLKYPKSIQTIPKHSSGLGLHPTQKPVELYEYFYRTYSDPDALVLDCCAGSGTAAIAAIRTGRRAILIEKDPVYFQTMCHRIDEELANAEAPNQRVRHHAPEHVDSSRSGFESEPADCARAVFADPESKPSTEAGQGSPGSDGPGVE